MPSHIVQAPGHRGRWLHEIKHDGFLVIARKNGERVRLYSRAGNDLTKQFVEPDPLNSSLFARVLHDLITKHIVGIRSSKYVRISDDAFVEYESFPTDQKIAAIPTGPLVSLNVL
jgi:ATP-dependent DNA ligase